MLILKIKSFKKDNTIWFDESDNKFESRENFQFR